MAVSRQALGWCLQVVESMGCPLGGLQTFPRRDASVSALLLLDPGQAGVRPIQRGVGMQHVEWVGAERITPADR